MKYIEYGPWLQKQLGVKVQKITINAGFTCPNRDGHVGRGGCTFCNNQTFNPQYCQPRLSVREQLLEGKRFFAHKYPEMRYLAYFQAYTSTYASVEHCIALYEEALRVEGVVGIVIGTRPDCMPPELLQYLAELSRRTFVMIEYGVESCNDETLRRVNRGHDFACSRRAIEEAAAKGLMVGAHIILGLPGEDKAELLRQAEHCVAPLPLTSLKLHQLQIIRGTEMHRQYEENPWPLYTVDEYIDLVLDYIRLLPPTLVLDRFTSSSPKELLVAPQWGLKNYEFVNLLKKRMEK